MKCIDFFFTDDGFSTAGVAVALLLTCSLIFSSTYMYEIYSASSEVQYVADASSMAAAQEVASYMTAVRICDAVLLSVALAGVMMIGIGVVCCCVPQTAAEGTKLIEQGRDILKKQERLGSNMIAGLNNMQFGLGAVATGQAMAVASENSTPSITYGSAIEVVPMDGEPILDSTSVISEELMDELPQKAEDITANAEKAEEATKKIDAARHEAYMHDCGNYPNYCMSERAKSLSGIDDSRNPQITSEDLWSFQDALDRARVYYAARASQEVPFGDTFEDKVNSILAARYYDYAVKALEEAYVVEQDGMLVDALLPLLPSNMSELKKTDLYTDKVYPLSGHGEVTVIHAWSGCPECGDSSRRGSAFELDEGLYKECDVCKFNTHELSRVAAASSVIDNGFEFHYRRVAKAAEECVKEAQVAGPLIESVKSDVDEILSYLEESLSTLSVTRIEAYPPGRFGAVSAVYADWSDVLGPLPFVKQTDAGQGVAISAAAIVDDEQESVIESAHEGIKGYLRDEGLVLSDGIAARIWSSSLNFYRGGVDGLTQVIEETLTGLPLLSHAGLGRWAAEKVETLFKDIGLQPPNTAKPRVVVVNTSFVVARGQGVVSEGIKAAKRELEI